MDAKLPLAVVLALLIGSVASSTLGAPPGPATERAIALEATAIPCPHQPDGVCLAYDGVVPGPALDINLGDWVTLTLFNNVSSTVHALSAPQDLKDRLAASDVSFHVHGTALSAAEDGVHAHAGTGFVESVAKPGGSFTYHFRAAFVGTWHYHDHVLGADGEEGQQRGLFGALVVRSAAEPRPDRVLDLHVLDNGGNAGWGLNTTVPAGSSFDVALVGLGDVVWDVDFTAPDGGVTRMTTAPGLSDRYVVRDAQPGAYTWRASWMGFWPSEGQVVVS